MTDKAVILCVDDEDFVLDLFREALGDQYAIQAISNGNEALYWLQENSADLVILDVSMPDLDGYECCRYIKAQSELVDLPVLFLSARDALEDRLRGFEVGGDDYLTKPFNLPLLQMRVRNLLALTQERRQLRETLTFARNTAMTAMISMSELGPLLEALKNYNGCQDLAGVSSATLNCMAQFGLEGVVQLRGDNTTFTLTSRGPASPLDLSVIAHMSGMNRIEQFRSRLSVNYEHVTLLVNNMPSEDEEDRAGRLRDHLAMLAEAADVRVRGLNTQQESARRGDLIAAMISEISDTLQTIDAIQRERRGQTTITLHEVTVAIENALLGVSLSEAQEAFLSGVIHDGLEQIAKLQTSDLIVQNRLSNIVNQLRGTREPAPQAQPSRTQ